jgi:hypothetical protein
MNDSDIIFAYTRQDAINDGVFIEVDENLVKEAGINFPVAVTSNLYHKYINPKTMPTGQDEQGRLWDVLWMFRNSAKNAGQSNYLSFKVYFSRKLIELHAVCEPRSQNDPRPAINIMLPEDR